MALSPQEEQLQAQAREIQVAFLEGAITEEERDLLLEDLMSSFEDEEGYDPSIGEEDEFEEAESGSRRPDRKRQGRKKPGQSPLDKKKKQAIDAAKKKFDAVRKRSSEAVKRGTQKAGQAIGGAAKKAGVQVARAVAAFVTKNPYVILAIVIIVVVIMLGIYIWQFFGAHSNDVNERAFYPVAYFDKENSKHTELLDKVIAKTEGADARLALSEPVRADLEKLRSDEEARIDVRILGLLDYLTDKHEYIRVDLIKDKTPDYLGFHTLSGRDEETGAAEYREDIGASGFKSGKAFMISAVDYSKLPELPPKTPVEMSWQKVYSERNLRDTYERLQVSNYLLEAQLDFAVMGSEADIEKRQDEESNPNVQALVDVIGRHQAIIQRLLDLPAISDAGRTHFTKAMEQFSLASELVALSRNANDQTILDALETGVSETYRGMQAAHMKNWDKAQADGDLSFKKARESRNKIREVELDIKKFSLEYDASLKDGVGTAEARLDFYQPNQVIVFAPEDAAIDNNFNEMDVYPPGIISIDENGVRYPSDEGSSGDGKVDLFDRLFSHKATNRGIISRTGSYFLYPKDTETPEFRNECAARSVAEEFIGKEDQFDKEKYKPVFVSYCGYIYISF